MKFSDVSKRIAYKQSFAGQPDIKGLVVHTFSHIPSDEGDFSEILRLNTRGYATVFPGFKIRQFNRTQMFPGCIKAWHAHKRQNEAWYIPPTQHLIAGFWDIRADSQTSGVTKKVVLGQGFSRIIFIPKGVAHGSVNVSMHPVELFTFVSEPFSLQNADEIRLPWDSKGADFWRPERD